MLAKMSDVGPVLPKTGSFVEDLQKCKRPRRDQCVTTLAPFFTGDIDILLRFILIYQRLRPSVSSLGSAVAQYLATDIMILDTVCFIYHKMLATVSFIIKRV